MVRYTPLPAPYHLELSPSPARPVKEMEYQQRLPNIMYDAGPMTLSAFLANNLRCQSMLNRSNRNEVCPLCSKVMCHYKVFARDHKTHRCSDLASCEPAVCIRSCSHIIGARCLVRHIRARKNDCPICAHVWFKPAGTFIQESALRKSKLWSWCWGWDLGHDEDDPQEADDLILHSVQ